MDPLSVAASTLTVLGTVSTAAQLVIEFKESPQELLQLESELNHLQAIANTLHTLSTSHAHKCVDPAVFQYPLEKLRDARKLLDVRFPKKNGATRADYKRSMHRNHIRKLRREVGLIRQDFNATIGLLTLSSLAADLPNSYKLELSSTYAPEHYVTSGPLLEPLIVYSSVELYRTATFRVHQYLLLFAQNGRRWRRVVATTTIYSTHDVFSGVYDRRIRTSALGPLHDLLAKALTGVQDHLYESITDVRMQVGAANLVPNAVLSLTESPKASKLFENSKWFAEASQRGLSMFPETDIVVIKSLAHTWFLVRMGSRHYLERRAPFVNEETSSSENMTNDFWQDLQPLLSVQGCPFIANLSGIIVDNTRTRLCGCLVELPERGTLGTMFGTAEQAGVSIPWEYKRKWIYQLVTAVAELHRRGVVVGSFYLPQIWLDSKDDLLLVEFFRRSEDLTSWPGQLPPEFRNGQSHELTFTSDLFLMGLAIWLICEQRRKSHGIFCRKSPCTSVYQYRCTAPHSDPVELPPFSSKLKIPSNVQSIIRSCRQKEPTQRLPASELLKMLSVDNLSCPSLETRVVLLKPSAMEVPNHRFTCNECGNRCDIELYSCNICNNADFDLCPACFLRGIRCWDIEHRLFRRKNVNSKRTFTGSATEHA